MIRIVRNTCIAVVLTFLAFVLEVYVRVAWSAALLVNRIVLTRSGWFLPTSPLEWIPTLVVWALFGYIVGRWTRPRSLFWPVAIGVIGGTARALTSHAYFAPAAGVACCILYHGRYVMPPIGGLLGGLLARSISRRCTSGAVIDQEGKAVHRRVRWRRLAFVLAVVVVLGIAWLSELSSGAILVWINRHDIEVFRRAFPDARLHGGGMWGWRLRAAERPIPEQPSYSFRTELDLSYVPGQNALIIELVQQVDEHVRAIRSQVVFGESLIYEILEGPVDHRLFEKYPSIYPKESPVPDAEDSVERYVPDAERN